MACGDGAQLNVALSLKWVKRVGNGRLVGDLPYLSVNCIYCSAQMWIKIDNYGAVFAHKFLMLRGNKAI